MPERIVTCRMTNRLGNRCTAEAIDPGGEAVICVRHAAEVMRTLALAEKKAATR
ncbi:hypothetical protein [Streptomyces sp. NPDC008141]|uniref:hypothetical protein n=1 Tax=Streptomyces sp. NPDC008141 TaxID=3364815 RepID=UPI0036F04EFF